MTCCTVYAGSSTLSDLCTRVTGFVKNNVNFLSKREIRRSLIVKTLMIDKNDERYDYLQELYIAISLFRLVGSTIIKEMMTN